MINYPAEPDNKLEEILCGEEADFNTVNAPVFFCRGNHEDFQSLSEQVKDENIKAIDFYGRINWLRPGFIHEVSGIKISAVGGGTEPDGTPEDDYGLEEPWKWVNNRAVKSLFDKEFQILISHTSPKGIGGASDIYGSERLRTLVEKVQPEYHLFSHHKTK